MKSGTPNKYPGGVFVWQKQKSDILCKCGCGEFITNRSARNLEQGKPNAGYIHGHIWKGKELPQHIKDKMNANRRDNKGEKNPNYGKGLFGADNPNWQGGKTLLYKKGNHPGVNTPSNLAFREWIRKRDGQCVLCGKIGRLDVHHIVSWVESEAGRHDPMNCVTLCKPCHARADNTHHKERIRPMLQAYLDTLAI